MPKTRNSKCPSGKKLTCYCKTIKPAAKKSQTKSRSKSKSPKVKSRSKSKSPKVKSRSKSKSPRVKSRSLSKSKAGSRLYLSQRQVDRVIDIVTNREFENVEQHGSAKDKKFVERIDRYIEGDTKNATLLLKRTALKDFIHSCENMPEPDIRKKDWNSSLKELRSILRSSSKSRSSY